MAYVFKDRETPPGWLEFKKRAPHKFFMPFFALTWVADWAAYFLGKWPVVELLEYIGSFSILFAAIVYFAGAGDRLKQKHYQAWQVINTAEGKGGSGGRGDALEELNEDHVSLIGVEADGAYLQGLKLENAQARRASFEGADLRNADLQHASLPDADLHFANFRGANLRDVNLSGARLDDADLSGADLSGADLNSVVLDRADLGNANLDHVKNWQSIKSVDKANIAGVRNAPAGFADWARTNGAVEAKAE
jgi:hypothetical protein